MNIDSKKPKPQRIVLPASAENSIGDMTGAFSNMKHHQLPTTFKPASNYVTAPITTFHPKGNVQTPANAHLSISTYHPKTSVSKLMPLSTTTTSAVKTSEKYSSRYDATTTMRPNVKKLLSTIGLEPDYTAIDAISTYKSTTAKPHKILTTTEKPELTPELKELLESFGLLTNEALPAHITADPEPYQDEFLPVYPSALTDESLSISEFKPLPKSITASEIDEQVEESFETKADDFSSFKPLPIPADRPSRRNDDEFKSILETYGLIDPDPLSDKKAMDVPQIQSRIDDGSTIERTNTKANKMLQIPEVDVQFLTPDLAKVLGEIGVKNVKSDIMTKTWTTTTQKIEETSTTPFTPAEQQTSATMENDLQKLHHLLDTIKELDKLNANLTEEELESLNPKNFNFSTDLSDQGPDPIESFYSSNYASKNEVKRQTNTPEPTKISLDLTITTTSSSINDSSDEATSDSNSDESKADVSSTTESKATVEATTAERIGKSEKDSVSSTTEESRNGSISDLADSFGGNEGLDPVSEEPLPPPKKNGFYFFSDWNSFLEVGLEDDKVEVRFDPKIGDSSPFIPVKIP